MAVTHSELEGEQVPFYSYSRGEEVIERFYDMGKQPEFIKRRGRKYFRDIAADHRHFRNTPGNYPYWSDALAVPPDDIQRTTELYRKKGISATFNREGQLLIEGPRQRKRLAEARGFYDRNGGYSDPSLKYDLEELKAIEAEKSREIIDGLRELGL
jgi:hypothetical protein